MKNINIHFRNHIFFYLLVQLVAVTSIASYYRFIINHDYIIAYEGVCDPTTEKCFIGCEDDECIDEYYYSKAMKYAPDLYRECGDDITDCEAAKMCLPDDDPRCSVTYCDAEIDGDTCTTPTEESNAQNDNKNESTEDILLQKNNTNNIYI